MGLNTDFHADDDFLLPPNLALPPPLEEIMDEGDSEEDEDIVILPDPDDDSDNVPEMAVAENGQQIVVVQDGQQFVMVENDQQMVVAANGQQMDVAENGQQMVVPHNGQQMVVPHNGQQMIVPQNCQQMAAAQNCQQMAAAQNCQQMAAAQNCQQMVVPQNGQQMIVPQNGHHMPVPQNGHHMPVPQNGQLMAVLQNGQHIPVPQIGQQMAVPQNGQQMVVQQNGQQLVVQQNAQQMVVPENAPQMAQCCSASQMNQPVPVPGQALQQGVGGIQHFRYQLPGVLVQCAVQTPGQVEPVYHEIVLHSPEIFVDTNGNDITAFVAPNEILPQQNVVEAEQVGDISGDNSVRNRGVLFLVPPHEPGVPENPGPSGSIVIYHEQVLMAPPNVRFGPITRLNTGQIVPQHEDIPETPSDLDDQESEDEVEIDADSYQNLTEKEQDADVTSSYGDTTTEEAIDNENLEDLEDDSTIPLTAEAVEEKTDIEKLEDSEDDPTIPSTAEAVEEKTDIEKLEDSEDDPTIPSTDNNGDKDTSDVDEKVASEKEEASSQADLTSNQISEPEKMGDSKGNGQSNQQALRVDSIPQVLRNGGIWVLPPGLVRGMKPRPQQPKLSDSEGHAYLGFWPMHFEVEPLTELEQQLGVMVPQPGRSNDGDSAAHDKENTSGGTEGSSETDTDEELPRENKYPKLENEMGEEKTEDQ